jgi:hypothetical protein
LVEMNEVGEGGFPISLHHFNSAVISPAWSSNYRTSAGSSSWCHCGHCHPRQHCPSHLLFCICNYTPRNPCPHGGDQTHEPGSTDIGTFLPLTHVIHHCLTPSSFASCRWRRSLRAVMAAAIKSGIPTLSPCNAIAWPETSVSPNLCLLPVGVAPTAS